MKLRLPMAARVGLALVLIGISLSVGWNQWVIEQSGDAYWRYESIGEDVFFWTVILVTVGSILFIRSLLTQRESGHRQILALTEPGPQAGKLDFGRRRQEPEPARKKQRLPATVWLTMRLILVALVSCSASLFSLPAFCVALGLSLLIFFASIQLGGQAPDTPILSGPRAGGPHFQWAQRLPLRPRFFLLPQWGLIGTSPFFVVVLLLWMLQPLTPRGLPIHLIKPGALPATSDAEPLIVHLKSNPPGKAPNVFLQSKPISWNALSGALNDELKVRHDWIVYFQADPDLDWKDAIRAMDIIRGTPAKVVMLTPKTQRSVRGNKPANAR